MPLVHHELCFGCGRTNLFGLLSELERDAHGAVRGRCFIKQDHQGPTPGRSHPGVVAAALLEAISHVTGPDDEPASLELSFEATAPVGGYLELVAQAGEGEVSAEARASGLLVARARLRGMGRRPYGA